LSVQFSITAKFKPQSIIENTKEKIKLVFTPCEMVTLSAFKYLEKEVQGDSFKIALYNFVETDFGCTMSPNTLYTMLSTLKSHKNPIKDQWSEPSQGRQNGKAKE